MFEKRNDNKQGNVQQETAITPAPVSHTLGKTAMIGPGIVINGDISGEENLVIEGRVEGKVHLPGHQVEVGKSGRVHADVTAKFVRVEGELHGDIDGKEKVIIAKSGNVRGNISAPRVMLEDGAIFKGSIDIDPAASAPVELAVPSQKPADNVKTLGAEVTKKETSFTAKGV